MDSVVVISSRDYVKCCNCGWVCSITASSSDPSTRTVKRKYQDHFLSPGFDLYSNAKILVENECISLREALCIQRKQIDDLSLELEEERNASASAVNETMSMILRLQREKAEIQMEARQFKTFAEEKMWQYQDELLDLEERLCEKELAIEALTCEIEAYKHRMLSYGIDSHYDTYASLKCNVGRSPNASKGNADVIESPNRKEHLKCLEDRINEVELENGDYVEKEIVGHSPRSTTSSVEKMESLHTYCACNGREDTRDRIYTTESINGVSKIGVNECKKIAARVSGDLSNDLGFEKLCMRLQVLEAGKESLRHAVLSMQTDEAQLVLQKEIAKQLPEEMGWKRRISLRKIPFLGSFSIMTVFKWITSFVLWRRRERRKKYVYSVSANNKGLLMLLEKGSRSRRWRCLTTIV